MYLPAGVLGSEGLLPLHIREERGKGWNIAL